MTHDYSLFTKWHQLLFLGVSKLTVKKIFSRFVITTFFSFVKST